MAGIFSIGHSTIQLQEFIILLKDNSIDYLIDTRGMPFSKFASQFNQPQLLNACNLSNIKYIHYPKLSGNIVHNAVKTNSSLFKPLLYLVEISKNNNICIMGANKDLDKCHRYDICSMLFKQFDINVIHIFTDKTILHSSLNNQIELF